MLDIIKNLVKDKEEIEMEKTETVKMLVPMAFKLVDGKCVNEGEQALYDFFTEREDVEVDKIEDPSEVSYPNFDEQ